MRAQDVMTAEPVCCTPDTSIEAAARMMVDCDCGAIPVVGNLTTRMALGMITDRDIVTRVIAQGRDPSLLTVRDCMTTPAVTVGVGTRLRDCVELLELSQIRRAIVVDANGAVFGIISQADIAAHASKRKTGDLVREVSKPSTPVFVR